MAARHIQPARVFATEQAAQGFADSLHNALSDRDENPANGGFAVRLGAGCRDPWPTTRRDVIRVSQTEDMWCVPIDGVVDADDRFDRETGRQSLDLSEWDAVPEVVENGAERQT